MFWIVHKELVLILFSTGIATGICGLARDCQAVKKVMEDCLLFFQNAIEHPSNAIPWDQWWTDHSEDVRRSFSRADYLKLKFHKLIAAREILVREHRIKSNEQRIHPLDQTHCVVCGLPLFKALPHITTQAEIIEFANRIGRTDLATDQWIHPGVYCPNGCTNILLHFRND